MNTVKFLFGSVLFLIAGVQAAWLNRFLGFYFLAQGNGTPLPPTIIEQSFVSVGVFFSSIVAVAMFIVWVARDRWNVERRIIALEDTDKRANDRHAEMSETVRHLASKLDKLCHSIDTQSKHRGKA